MCACFIAWTAFAEHQDAAGSNWWIVPNTPSTQCLVMVADAKDGTPMDVSNAPFTILPAVPVAANGTGAIAARSGLDVAAPPAKFDLAQNYPNPFNPETTIRYSLAADGNVRLTIFDMLGKEVAVLADGFQQAGEHQVSWNAAHLASGSYFYRLESGGDVMVRRMTLLR